MSPQSPQPLVFPMLPPRGAASSGLLPKTCWQPPAPTSASTSLSNWASEPTTKTGEKKEKINDLCH